jgi:hypothetical protein
VSPTRIRFVLSEEDRVEFTVLRPGSIKIWKFDRTGQSVTAVGKA